MADTSTDDPMNTSLAHEVLGPHGRDGVIEDLYKWIESYAGPAMSEQFKSAWSARAGFHETSIFDAAAAIDLHLDANKLKAWLTLQLLTR